MKNHAAADDLAPVRGNEQGEGCAAVAAGGLRWMGGLAVAAALFEFYRASKSIVLLVKIE